MTWDKDTIEALEELRDFFDSDHEAIAYAVRFAAANIDAIAELREEEE